MLFCFLVSLIETTTTLLSETCEKNGNAFGISLEWMDQLGFDENFPYTRFKGRSRYYFSEIGQNNEKEEYTMLDQSLEREETSGSNKLLFDFRVTVFEKLFAPNNNGFQISCYSREKRGYLLFSTKGETRRVSKKVFISLSFPDRLVFYVGAGNFFIKTNNENAIFADYRVKDFFLVNGEWGTPVLPRLQSIYRIQDVARLDLSHGRFNAVRDRLLNDKDLNPKPTSKGYVDMPLNKFWSPLNFVIMIYEGEKVGLSSGSPEIEAVRQELLKKVQEYSLRDFDKLPSLERVQKFINIMLGKLPGEKGRMESREKPLLL